MLVRVEIDVFWKSLPSKIALRTSVAASPFAIAQNTAKDSLSSPLLAVPREDGAPLSRTALNASSVERASISTTDVSNT
jgi:hypothetical protein